MQLVLAPNELLTQECTSVDKVTKEIKDQVFEMMQVMLDNKGIGLSAPQVGILNKVLVMDTTIVDSVNGFKGAMINPVIMRKANVKRDSEEGCLSFPGILLTIKRPIEVSIKYKDVNNKMKFLTLKGITATCFQHEFDHLRGLTFDKVGKL